MYVADIPDFSLRSASFEMTAKGFSNSVLVGMWASGKSFWSGKISRSCFRRMYHDELIAARLVADPGIKRGRIAAVRRWMGFPFRPYYRGRETTYSASGMEVISQDLAQADGGEAIFWQNIFIDATGSVVYTSDKIFK
jgi:hypothetical protein